MTVQGGAEGLEAGGHVRPSPDPASSFLCSVSWQRVCLSHFTITGTKYQTPATYGREVHFGSASVHGLLAPRHKQHSRK